MKPKPINAFPCLAAAAVVSASAAFDNDDDDCGILPGELETMRINRK